MRNKIALLFLVGAFVFTSLILFLAGMESENYRISRSVLSGGGGFMGSENYGAGATLGQASPIGLSSSENYDVHAGFWVSIPIATFRDELVLSFGAAYGLYQYDQAGGWKQWNTVSPSQMVTVDLNGDGSDELVAGFPGYGLYKKDSAKDWQKINDVETWQYDRCRH